jgi:hypothetical protein
MSTTLAPGLLNVTNEEHHAIRALSNSGMRDLAVSPLRYWYRWINPAPKREEESPAMSMGSALHCAVLEPDAFDARYACELDPSDWPVCLDTVSDIRGWITDKGGKPKGTLKADLIRQALELMDEIGEQVPILEVEKSRFLAANEGKMILHGNEWQRVAGMTLALSAEPALRQILATGKAEQTLIARDPETGAHLKARLDWMTDDTLDLKTFTQKRGKSIEESIADAIWYECYHRQAWFYSYVREIVTGKPSGFVFAFVESDQPHEVRIVRMGKSSLYWQVAEAEARGLIRRYAACLKRFGDAPWREEQPIQILADEDIKQLAWAR